MHGGLGICRRFPAVSVTDSQRLVSPERVPSGVVTRSTNVDQAVCAPGVSSLILVTDDSGEMTFIDGVTVRWKTAGKPQVNKDNLDRLAGNLQAAERTDVL